MDAGIERAERQQPVRLRQSTTAKYRVGDSDKRPWGDWAVLDVGNGYIVKRIRVDPGQRLSLQFHHHRAEDWTVISGKGIVEIAGKPIGVGPGTHVHIPTMATHRISNTGDEVLTFIEIQRGEVLDETDIVRLSDDYGR
ncbi:cupin domain-containing protein [Oleomonas cavernae]|uniref:Cupin domain-containing protein n=1 Tax=Oleomonas cavernae TaxID=2320859 RepID=A0A418WTL0_9PROT|nr:phosphomannose isomerase type II C-terminal cupin domain [Oleomonas cavernae]RJF94499.1 cupin domain-containing protein [Oleomonas cavernae]